MCSKGARMAEVKKAELVQIMVHQFSMPEEQIKAFLDSAFKGRNSLTLEELREVTVGLLQDAFVEQKEKDSL